MTDRSGTDIEPDDDLDPRLDLAGRRWADAEPAVPERVWDGVGRRGGSRGWLPLTAAAAVAAVAAGSFGLVHRLDRPDGPVPITRTVAAVDGRASFQPAPQGGGPDVAPAPDPAGDRRHFYSGPCQIGEVTATLDLSGAGTLQLSGGAPREQPCGLPGRATSLTIVDGSVRTTIPIRYLAQPAVPNPPARNDEVLTPRSPLTGDVDWPSWCGPRQGRLELEGLTADPVPVTLTGGLPPCTGRSAPLRLNTLSSEGAPTGIVPAARAGLRVAVDYPAEVPPGVVRPYTVRLQNPTGVPISLSPCPTYLLTQVNPKSGIATAGPSGGDTATLPCDRLPSSLNPGDEVTVVLEARFGYQDPKLRGLQVLSLSWGIAGTAADEQAVSMRFPDPAPPVADVPWRDTAAPPGQPREPKVGEGLPYAPLTPTVQGLPATARPGQVLRYSVRLANTATGGPAVPLDPCPGFVQYLQLGLGGPERDEDVDEHYINCPDGPTGIPAGKAVLLRMELTVPDNAPAGTAMLTWKVSKLDSGGSPSDFAEFTVER